MIESITFTARQKGPKFLVLGAVHGNEKCGTVAIKRVIKEIEAGKIELKRGQVTFVPVCNPRAYKKNVRFTKRNLNRYLVPMKRPNTYEAELGNILCPLLAACDVLLDIHSYTAGGPPFVFVGSDNPKEHEYAALLGDVTLMCGWQEAYAATGRNKKAADKDESTGTTEYARRFGALAVTLECGQHKDPASPEIAYRAIRNTFGHLGMSNGNPGLKRKKPAKLVEVTHVFYRDDDGRLAKSWKHLDPVTRNEPLAFRAAGTAILAPANGFIIMPKADTPLGQEWFYFGKRRPINAPRPNFGHDRLRR